MLFFLLTACNDQGFARIQEFMNEVIIVDGGGTPSDVMFFLDTSCSMTEELETMADELVPFVSRLARFSDDWQLMATADRSGCAVTGVLSPETDYFVQFFRNTVLDPDGASGIEEGLYAMVSALAATGPGQCNEGFLRDDGQLHVVFVSDERDQSLGFEGENYWKDYADFVLSLKGDPNLVRFSAVTGPTPHGCGGSKGRAAEAGHGYAELVDYTGGELLSICSSWEDDIEVLANTTVQETDFSLDRIPLPETLLVTRNEATTTAWSYLSAENLVRLDEPAQGGDRIEIDYEIDLAAEQGGSE